MNKQVFDNLKTGIIMLFILIFLLGSCSDRENIVVFTNSEAIRLLSNDSSKTWERRNVVIDGQTTDMSECELFSNTIYVSRNDSLIYLTKTLSDYCDGHSDLLDSGLWDVLEESTISDRIDRIAYYSFSGDTTIKNIRELTAIILTTEDDSGSSVLQETFESRLPN